MIQQKAKYYPKTKKILPIADDLTLIGEESPLDKARLQNGVDENFDDHGKFLIVDFISSPDVHYEYDSGKGNGEAKKISEEEWNKLPQTE